jgi:signal peptidase I
MRASLYPFVDTPQAPGLMAADYRWLFNVMRSMSLGEVLRTLAIALAVAAGVHRFLVAPYWIPSGSMVPALRPGDCIAVTKLLNGPFRRGEVVVFTSPTGSGEVLVKRIIGLPGDSVQFKAGRLFLNGREVPCADKGHYEDVSGAGPVVARICTETLPGGAGYPILKVTDDGFANNTPLYTMPPGNLFLLGDNRDNSEDSRDLGGPVGYVPEGDVIGRAVLVLGSVDPRAQWLGLRLGRFFQRVN